MTERAKHFGNCSCEACQEEWERWTREQEERAYQEGLNRYAEAFYRDNPHD